MEEKVDMESCGIMKGDEVPVSYHVVARTGENPFSQFCDSVVAPVVQVVGPDVSVQPAMAVEPAVGAMQVVNGVVSGTEMKKKRGRPRKHGLDGKPTALTPMPISASIPLAGQLLSWKPSKVRPVALFKKKCGLEFESPDSQVACSVGANFTPHMITVNAGEDVSMKIISFSQQRSRVICILAANGSISNVTLHQPNSSGGTMTYEGRFEILSLSGSFIPTDSGGTKSRSGGMSVSLAGPDGCVLGGGLGGLLVAAGPVQVIVGSFLHHQQEHKPKKQKVEGASALAPIPANHTFHQGTQVVYSTPQQSLSPAPYQGNNISFGNFVQGSTVLGV